MKKWTYITVEDFEEMKRLAEKYKLPPPSQIQPMRIKEEKNENKGNDRQSRESHECSSRGN